MYNYVKVIMSSIPSPYYSIVLPPAEDPACIETNIARVCEVLEKAIPDRYEIIVIEREEVREIAEALRPIYKNIQVITSEGPAVARGWEQANGDILGVLDGDLTSKPTSLTEITKTIDEGADLAITSQYSKHDDETDPSMGCFAIRRTCLSNLNGSPRARQLLIEMLGKENFDCIMENQTNAKQTSETTLQIHSATCLEDKKTPVGRNRRALSKD